VSVFAALADWEMGVAARDDEKIARRRNNRKTGEKVLFIYSSFREHNLHF
jgi:hypothetical protein